MTLPVLFKYEIETTNDVTAATEPTLDVAADPQISGFFAGVLATVDDRDDLSAEDRERVKALATGPGRNETPAALIQRIEDLTPYLPTLAEMAGGE